MTRNQVICCWLTHRPLVPHICVSESDQHWFRQWLVAYSAPSHYLNQCQVIVNRTLKNELQWNFNQNTKLFIHENASEISSAKWWPFCAGENVFSNMMQMILKIVNLLATTWDIPGPQRRPIRYIISIKRISHQKCTLFCWGWFLTFVKHI